MMGKVSTFQIAASEGMLSQVAIQQAKPVYMPPSASSLLHGNQV